MKLISSAAVLLCALSCAARAADIEALSGQPRRDACVGYIWIDINVRHDAGAMSDQAFANEKMRIMNKLYTANGSTFGAGTGMRIAKVVDAIVAEDPSMAEVMNTAATCRTYLRL